MERIDSSAARTEEDDDADADDLGTSTSGREAASSKSLLTNRFAKQHIDPIHVIALPLLTPTLARDYLVNQLRRTAPTSFLLKDDMNASPMWTEMYHQLHRGHFGMINILLQLDIIASNEVVSFETLRSTFLRTLVDTNLRSYEEYFGTSIEMRRNLANFFVQHLAQGFYSDFLRQSTRNTSMSLHSQLETRTNVARDFNLIAANRAQARGQVEWIHRHIGERDTPAVIREAAPWIILKAPVQFERMAPKEIEFAQHLKVESFLQLIAMALTIKQKIDLTPLSTTTTTTSVVSASSSLSRPLSVPIPVSSFHHWCAVTDPPILNLAELELDTLNGHWSVPPAKSASDDSAPPPPTAATSAFLTRFVHVTRNATDDSQTLTLFLPNLSSKLADLLFVAPTRPITNLMHTLYLHYLADLLKILDVCVGPSYQVRAHASADGDRSSYSWHELDEYVDIMQAMGDTMEPQDWPLQGTAITQLRIHKASASSSSSATTPIENMHVRVCFMSPFANHPAPTNAITDSTVSAASPSHLTFHPLLQFMDAVVGSELAALLSVDRQQLEAIPFHPPTVPPSTSTSTPLPASQ